MATYNRLFIAEKASAGKALAEHLGKAAGVKVVMHSAYAEVGADRVAWMSGHLLEQVDAAHYNPAYAKWRLNHLPIIPAPFVLVPKKDPKSRAKEKISAIRDLLKDATSVVGFGDPDAEGQLLQDQLLIHLNNKKSVLRLWCSALDNASLAKALACMKPNSEYLGLYEAALCRSESDWLYGINMTRACAVHAQNAGADFKITVGRVQTPTLYLMVERELAIGAFKPLDYHIPVIGLATDPRFKASWFADKTVTKDETGKDESVSYEDPRVDEEGRLCSKTDADAIVAGAMAVGKATVLVSTVKPGAESAPLPFSLSALQAHCSRLFGLSASATLEVAQALYQKKITSYPRVDCDFLPESQHADAAGILASISKATVPVAISNALRGANASLKSRAWNDTKVTAHHAIIPAHLDNPGDIARLPELELKVYLEIVKRYVLQFWAPAKFLASEVVLSCGPDGAQEKYSVSGRQYTDDGWRKAFTLEAVADDDADASFAGKATAALPLLKKGQVLQLSDASLTSKRTTCPKRFTEGTLITAMKQIHLYVKNPSYRKNLKEGSGIGTEATRGNILKSFFDKGFAVTKGKEVVPTAEAMQLMAALPGIMKRPDLTAMWQQLNDDVAARRSNHAEFIGRLVPWLTKMVEKSATFFTPAQFPNGKPRVAEVLTEHKCFGSVDKAGCGSPLRAISGKFGPYFGCSNEACGKNFRSINGLPVEKTAPQPESAGDPKYACLVCNKGFLRPRERKDGTGRFWGCSNFTGGCKAIYSERDGEPDIVSKSSSSAAKPAYKAKPKPRSARAAPRSQRSS